MHEVAIGACAPDGTGSGGGWVCSVAAVIFVAFPNVAPGASIPVAPLSPSLCYYELKACALDSMFRFQKMSSQIVSESAFIKAAEM